MVAAVAGIMLMAAVLVTPGYASAAPVGCPSSGFPESTNPAAGQSSSRRPVVLVHGWTGSPMTATAEALSSALHGRISTFTFNYHGWSARWASNPHIAGCLAGYLAAVAAKYKAAGGDGKLIVVAHSMGGLAVRYAMSPDVSHPIGAATVPYVITFDTPYEGSPFGGNKVSTIKEIPQAIAKPLTLLSGADGGRCLAAHHGTDPLHSGCGDPPPYLPPGVDLTEVGGDVTIDRALFGVTLYSLPLASDGIVPILSEHGYLASGPAANAPVGAVQVHSLTDTCHVGAGELAKTFATAFFPLLEAFDYGTLKNLQSDTFTPAVGSVLLAAAVAGPCSHIKVVTDRPAITQIAATMSAALDTLASKDMLASLAGTWSQHGFTLTIKNHGTGELIGINYDPTNTAPGPPSYRQRAMLTFTTSTGGVTATITSVVNPNADPNGDFYEPWYHQGLQVQIQRASQPNVIDLGDSPFCTEKAYDTGACGA